MRHSIAAGGGTRQAGSRAGKLPAAPYLTPPDLGAVQETVTTASDAGTLCRLLAGLRSFAPLDDLLRDEGDPARVLTRAVKRWLERFMPEPVVRELAIAIRILPAGEADSELFGEVPDGEWSLVFTVEEFVNRWFPVGEIISAYEQRQPGLGKYLLQMLSDCPLLIGTPANMYEMTSYFCWYDEDNEESVWGERYQEYLDSGESEEDARDTATESVLVNYAEFEENLPLWTFDRQERRSGYRQPVPPEFAELERFYRAYRRRRKPGFIFPNANFPAIFASWDQTSHELFCEVLNRIANDHCQCGNDYCLSGLAWHFPPDDSRSIRKTFREIESVLGYFAACIDFLLKHEKEEPRDD